MVFLFGSFGKRSLAVVTLAGLWNDIHDDA